MKTDFKNDLISEIHSDFTTDMYYFSIITSKSFFYIQDFMQKKNSEDPQDPRYINDV